MVGSGGAISPDELRAVLTRLSAPAAPDAATGIELIALLEQVKSAAAAAQARQTVAFEAARRAEQTAAGLPAREVGRGIALEVGLARRQSHHHAGNYLGWARILVGELPRSLSALQAGLTTEWRAMLVARETGWLSREHRADVDSQLAPPARPTRRPPRRSRGPPARHAARPGRQGRAAPQNARAACRHHPPGTGHHGLPHRAPAGHPSRRLRGAALRRGEHHRHRRPARPR